MSRVAAAAAAAAGLDVLSTGALFWRPAWRILCRLVL
jgi:hypothetical protein